MNRKNFVKIIIILLIIFMFIIYTYTLAAESQNINMTIVKNTNVDLILSKGKTSINLTNFEEDLKNALLNEGIDPNRIKIQAIEANNLANFSNFTWKQDLDRSIGNITITNNGANVSMNC